VRNSSTVIYIAHIDHHISSWHNILQTANITDFELNERFRRTALYSALRTIFLKEQQEEGYDSTPESALMIPTTSEIASRWPGMSPDQVEAIAQDYQLESDRLSELELNDVYYRVKELAAHDVVW
jgi:nuclear pore complex protein Nup133